MDNCRIYVCKSYFGNIPSECVKFRNYHDYTIWLNNENSENYIFEPVCNCKEIFDKMILLYRSGKFTELKINNYIKK